MTAYASVYLRYDDTFFNQQTGTAMGAKFAPSYANFFMEQWEEDYPYSEKNPFNEHIVIDKRYIDDCIILWRFLEFITYINSNSMNICFTSEHDFSSICYLEFEIFITNGLLKTHTYFKQTDMKSYIDSSSCHYAPWMQNIPKGQMNRVRRNCTKKISYDRYFAETILGMRI